MTDLHESNAAMVLDPKNSRSIRRSFSVQADSQLSALLLPLYGTSESTRETFWDTGDSGSTPQVFSGPGNSQLSSSYASDVGPFDSHTTNGEVTADDFAGQYGSSSGSVDSLGGDFLQQVLAYLSDVDQGATAENSRLSGFPPSDIPVSRGITPSFPSVFAPAVPRDVVQAQLELQHPPPSVESLSFTALCVIPRRSGTLSHGL
ncbi:hypothetical protein M405DRAFT_18410 [Rhizopogon salebrosus TDB-379]|nr:hypothetical protein M405DRAFT_18410 [Rhizopogon salebrosus TDB-379]